MAIRRDGPEDSRGFAFRGLAGMSGLNVQGQPLKRKDEKGKIFIKGISQIR